MASGAPDWWIQGIIPMTLLNLSDTPGDYIGRAGLSLKVNAGESALTWATALLDAHGARHGSAGGDAVTHNDLTLGTSDHHTKYSDADARGAINDIFGSDGKADKTIDLDGQVLESVQCLFGPEVIATRNDFAINCYYDVSEWKYVVDGYAQRITLRADDGYIEMEMAPSGLEDATITFTERFRLDASGNLTSVATYDGISLSKPISISCHDFISHQEDQDYTFVSTELGKRSSTDDTYFYTSLQLPHGKTMNGITLYGYRDDASAVMDIAVWRNDFAGNQVEVGSIAANWTSGYSERTGSLSTNPIVDNDNYCYFALLQLNPNDATADVRFTGCQITFS